MSFRRSRDPGDGGPDPRGVTGFLRSLLSRIPWSEKAEREETQVVKAHPGTALRVHNSNGRTRVVGEDRRDIEITAYKSTRAESEEAAQALLDDIRVTTRETPDSIDLQVETPPRWSRRGCAHLCVKVPQRTMVAVSAANGRVDVESIRGDVKARSSNGAVCVSDIVGDVEVATNNAKVSCGCIKGRLVARSSNGKIEIDEHCGSIDASTSNGAIRSCIEGVGHDGVVLATSNGRIVLDLPDEVDADVDVRVDNGVIRNDREMAKTTRDTGGRVQGRIGGGGPLIKLRTSNGSITLH